MNAKLGSAYFERTGKHAGHPEIVEKVIKTREVATTSGALEKGEKN